MSGEDSWVEVARVQNAVEAEVVRGLLESNGIRCLLQAHVVPHIHPYSLGPIAENRVLVPALDAERARSLLEESQEGEE